MGTAHARWTGLAKRLARPGWRLIAGSRWFQAMADRATCWERLTVRRFVQSDAGAAYGVTAADRRALVEAFTRNTRELECGTTLGTHVVLAQELLQLPRDLPGDVVECGVFKGASSASLSLVCRIVGRKLWVCDSFAGLPDEGHTLAVAPHAGVYGYYEGGMFCGPLAEVRDNLERFGAPEVCEFVVGYFAQSLAALTGPVALAFLDVDLASSTRDCLRHLWPRLAEDAAVYTDDAVDLECVKVFFDEPWWRATLDLPAPGYIGSGCGLPLDPFACSLGYTRKTTGFDPRRYDRVGHLRYPEAPRAKPNPALAVP